jgi:hypothetical protein
VVLGQEPRLQGRAIIEIILFRLDEICANCVYVLHIKLPYLLLLEVFGAFGLLPGPLLPRSARRGVIVFVGGEVAELLAVFAVVELAPVVPVPPLVTPDNDFM